jgi:hypothetical protein
MEDKAKIDLQEAGRGSMDWINLAQDRAVWQALVGDCDSETSGSTKCWVFLTSRKPVSFSRRTVLCGVSE